jgi:hypothetical protein
MLGYSGDAVRRIQGVGSVASLRATVLADEWSGQLTEKREPVPGPGSIRVARWIGRLGVVSLPAVEVGLSLEARVVRRHAARLEQAGWLRRAAGAWGKGSIAWLTQPGLVAIGLGGLRPVRASQSARVTAHGVLVAWSAARAERRGLKWQSARELSLERERWGVPVGDRPGEKMLLPDLAVWRQADSTPCGLVVEPGYRRPDRQQPILEAWRDAIYSGRYAGVRYDCGDEFTARRIMALGTKVGLDGSVFVAATQTSAAEISAIQPSPPRPQPQANWSSFHRTVDEGSVENPEPALLGGSPAKLRNLPHSVVPSEAQKRLVAGPPPESSEAPADRERRLRKILGSQGINHQHP